MSAPDLNELRALAEAASPGPWSIEYDSCDCGGGYPCSHGSWPFALHGPKKVPEFAPDGSPLTLSNEMSPSELSEMHAFDAEFIAAANPTVVLALIDDIGRLRVRSEAEQALQREERDHGRTIDQRDAAEEWADRLAYAIAPIDVIGEHSSANNPWANALAIAETSTRSEAEQAVIDAAYEWLAARGRKEEARTALTHIKAVVALRAVGTTSPTPEPPADLPMASRCRDTDGDFQCPECFAQMTGRFHHECPRDAVAAPATPLAPSPLQQAVTATSRLLDASYEGHGLCPEAIDRRRWNKIGEEMGEASEAYGGMVGENPRKGITHTLDDFLAELLDIAASALGAYEHHDHHAGRSVAALTEQAVRKHARLAEAIAGSGVADTERPEQ